MRFIRKKNLHEGEELLYIPRLHWMFIVRYVLWALLFFVVVLVVLTSAEVIADFFGYVIDAEVLQFFALAYKYVLFAAIAIAALLFLCGIIQHLCTEYGLTNRRLMIRKGVFRVYTADIPTDRIESVYCKQGIGGRMFNYGTLRVCGTGGGMMPVFFMVARPFAFRRKIVETIEKNKLITVVHGNVPSVVKPKKRDIEPLHRYGSFVRVVQDNS